MEKFKKLGLHHGLILQIVAWAALFIFNPLIGIIVSCSIATGYTFKEYQEGKMRGFDIMDVSTWKVVHFQWLHFITPIIFAAVNVFIMGGM